jgi:hypothetical protein
LLTIPAIDLDSIYDKVKASLQTGEPQNGEQPNVEHPSGEHPNGELPTTKELDIGRTVLMLVQSDGQRLCSKILQRVEEHKNSLAKECLTNAKYQVLVGHNKSNMWEEVVAYNNLLVNFTEDTAVVKEGEWKFKEIIHVTTTDPLPKRVPTIKAPDGTYTYCGRLGRYPLNPSRCFNTNLRYAPSTLENITCLTNKDGLSIRSTPDKKR